MFLAVADAGGFGRPRAGHREPPGPERWRNRSRALKELLQPWQTNVAPLPERLYKPNLLNQAIPSPSSPNVRSSDREATGFGRNLSPDGSSDGAGRW